VPVRFLSARSVKFNKAHNHAQGVCLQPLPGERLTRGGAAQARMCHAGEGQHILAHTVPRNVHNIVGGGVQHQGKTLAVQGVKTAVAVARCSDCENHSSEHMYMYIYIHIYLYICI